MFLKTTSGNGSIGEIELAVRIKLRISVIEGGVKQESLQDLRLVLNDYKGSSVVASMYRSCCQRYGMA